MPCRGVASHILGCDCGGHSSSFLLAACLWCETRATSISLYTALCCFQANPRSVAVQCTCIFLCHLWILQRKNDGADMGASTELSLCHLWILRVTQLGCAWPGCAFYHLGLSQPLGCVVMCLTTIKATSVSFWANADKSR